MTKMNAREAMIWMLQNPMKDLLGKDGRYYFWYEEAQNFHSAPELKTPGVPQKVDVVSMKDTYSQAPFTIPEPEPEAVEVVAFMDRFGYIRFAQKGSHGHMEITSAETSRKQVRIKWGEL
jgi:hypothetical protein